MKSLASSLALFLTAQALCGQTTASLRVEVLDGAGRPRPGALVSLESVTHGDRHVLRADDKGIATAAGLLPGTYRLDGQLLQLRADERIQIRLRREPAQASVAVEAALLEVESSSVTTQTIFSAEELARLPFAPHRYVEHSLLAPGVTPSGKP
jgi:hypothetical protein